MVEARSVWEAIYQDQIMDLAPKKIAYERASKRGWTTKLAEECGLDGMTVENMIMSSARNEPPGFRMSPQDRRRIAAALGIPEWRIELAVNLKFAWMYVRAWFRGIGPYLQRKVGRVADRVPPWSIVRRQARLERRLQHLELWGEIMIGPSRERLEMMKPKRYP